MVKYDLSFSKVCFSDEVEQFLRITLCMRKRQVFVCGTIRVLLYRHLSYRYLDNASPKSLLIKAYWSLFVNSVSYAIHGQLDQWVYPLSQQLDKCLQRLMVNAEVRCYRSWIARSRLDLAHSRATADTAAGARRATHEVGDGGDSEGSEAEPEEGSGGLGLTASLGLVSSTVGDNVGGDVVL